MFIEIKAIIAAFIASSFDKFVAIMALVTEGCGGAVSTVRRAMRFSCIGIIGRIGAITGVSFIAGVGIVAGTDNRLAARDIG